MMKKWKAARTLLLVGEGETEVAFLQHVKSLYVTRGCGLSVKTKNAHGKGAKHVVEWTIRQIGDYDTVAAMLDTDTDWSASVEKKAHKAKIMLLKSSPLLEALLLRMLGQSDQGNAKTLKARFAPYVKNDGCRPENYVEHFTKEALEAARGNEVAIDALLTLLGSLQQND